MRVIQVIGTLQVGGAENQVVQLANGFLLKGIDSHFVCLTDADTQNSKAIESSVKKYILPLLKRKQVSCVVRMVNLFRDIHPDIVQSHMFHTNLYVAIAARIAQVPVVIATEHGKNLWKNTIHHFIERQIISPLVSMRIAVSEDIKNIRIASGDVPEKKIAVVPPCVNLPAEPISLENGRLLRIGAVGRLVEAKNYPMLIRVLAQLLAMNVPARVTFIGDGPERNKLETLSFALGVEKFIQFSGFQDDVSKWLKKFDVIAFSSIREGTPVAMLEAMAAGVPVVATDVGGIPDVIDDGVNGLLIPSQDVSAMVKALQLLSKNYLVRCRLATAGRQRIIESYSRDIICGRYLQIYQSLLSEKTGK